MSADMLESFLKKHRVDIAILTLPKDAAQKTADILANGGVKGLLNFSYMELKLPSGISVENVHISDAMMTLSCKIKQGKDK